MIKQQLYEKKNMHVLSTAQNILLWCLSTKYVIDILRTSRNYV